VDDGRLDAHIPEGSQDAKSDFAAVSNQDALEAHGSASAESIYEESGPKRRSSRDGEPRFLQAITALSALLPEDKLPKALTPVYETSIDAWFGDFFRAKPRTLLCFLTDWRVFFPENYGLSVFFTEP
jgi:hypothetical protein